MFILDSLMIAGIEWALKTTIAAAEAEMNDDTALREQLLEMEMRREMGEVSDEEFAELEADVLARIREIKERREGSSGPLAFGGAEPMDTSGDSSFQVEASVSGDFYDPADAPHTTVVEQAPHSQNLLLAKESGDEIRVLDLKAGDPDPIPPRGPHPPSLSKPRQAGKVRASRKSGAVGRGVAKRRAVGRTARTTRTKSR